jgi:HAD superfamily hydrolase (TIGR01490 family)
VTKLAFYDLDGTLVSSNVVDQYLWYAKRSSWLRVARALLRAPSWILVERKSRLLFNEMFFREYAGLSEPFLRGQAQQMADAVLTPALYPQARAKLDADRAAGYELVLVTGSLDFAIEAFAKSLGFREVLANRMLFRGGVAQGELVPPVLAEAAKVDVVLEACARLGADPSQCKGYSDSTSDAPMLAAVGEPCAVNPSKGLLAIAQERGWPVISLK